jgi:predicted DNA-binding WGR domain protein
MIYDQTLCLERGTRRKLWRAEIHDRVVVTISGDVGTSLIVKKKTFRHDSAANVAVNREISQRLREGYRPISSEQFAALQAEAKPATAPSERARRGAASKVKTARSVKPTSKARSLAKSAPKRRGSKLPRKK